MVNALEAVSVEDFKPVAIGEFRIVVGIANDRTSQVSVLENADITSIELELGVCLF